MWTADRRGPHPLGPPGGKGPRRWSVWCVCTLTMGGDVMECRVCGGLVEWRSVACDQTQCRRCGATDSQVREEEQDDNAGPTGEDVAEAWGWLEASAGREWASADEATNDAGPTEADLRGEVDHG